MGNLILNEIFTIQIGITCNEYCQTEDKQLSIELNN